MPAVQEQVEAAIRALLVARVTVDDAFAPAAGRVPVLRRVAGRTATTTMFAIPRGVDAGAVAGSESVRAIEAAATHFAGGAGVGRRLASGSALSAISRIRFEVQTGVRTGGKAAIALQSAGALLAALVGIACVSARAAVLLVVI